MNRFWKWKNEASADGQEARSLEIYGEIDECSFDGKPMDKEAGKRYMDSLPEVNDIAIWWNEIQ